MDQLLVNSDLPQRLCTAWSANEWRNVHVVAAVSGGADSMTLLTALIEAKRRAAGTGVIYVGHVNHALRGADSDADEQWLRQQCESHGVPLLVRRCDTAALAAAVGDGIEAAARTARYQLLTEMAESVGARFVAVAHSRDDQIETTLLRLLRGTGLRGLGGMSDSRPLSRSVTLVRPLLGISRRELLDYLGSIGQIFREDGSNTDPRFTRNRLRNDLLPYLRAQFNPAVDEAIARLGELAAEADGALRAIAARLLANAASAHWRRIKQSPSTPPPWQANRNCSSAKPFG
jgi:tRNA(Ile)-lysidine synthase